ncbi:MAG: HlyD family efflux transporter periplasmic adaptor subunit [Kiritimatiellaeota bacterium]|nr:HlyD family efflux transporter periplasmic adaptor subunit [Kiritimatiellota bacterium]
MVTEQLQRVPNLVARGLIYIVSLLVVTILLYTHFVRIDILSRGQAVARPTAHKVRILADRRGYVDRVLVKEGQRVAAGDALFAIRSRANIDREARYAELKITIPLKEAHFKQRRALTAEKLRTLQNSSAYRRKVLALRKEKNALARARAEIDIRYWTQQVETLAESLARARSMFEKNITTLEDYNAAKGRLEHAKAQRDKSSNERQTYLKEAEIIEAEIKEEEANLSSQTEIVRGEGRSIELEAQSTLTAMRNEMKLCEDILSVQSPIGTTATKPEGVLTMIRTATPGAISELFVRAPGAYVRDGDLLCTVVPAGSPLYMDIVLANKDIGFITEGMPVKFRFDAFSYRDYGALAGRVESISPSAVEDPTMGLVYHVRGVLDQPGFKIDGKLYRVKPGMTATAELVTEQRTLFSILVSKLRR